MPPPQLSVAEARPEELAEGDAFIEAHLEGTLFQTTAWAGVVESAYGVSPIVLHARLDGVLQGVLPLFYFRSLLFGRRLVTAPFASWGALCATDLAAEGALLEKAVELGRSLGAQSLELRGPRAYAHPEICPGQTRWVNHVLPVRDPEELWADRLKGRARTAVRKARNSSVRIERGHRLFEQFYEIMAISMRRLGTPVHARSFYQAILAHLGERAELLLAFSRDTPIAAYLLVRDRRRMYHWTAGSRPGYQRLNANSLLMWTSLEMAHECGVEEFDFGRTPSGSGTGRFKEQWGGACVDLHYSRLAFGNRDLPDLAPTNPRFQLAIALWRRLPLPMTRLLGPWIMRSIP